MSTKITTAIAALIEETALKTVDDLVIVLSNTFVVDDEVMGLISQFKDNLKAHAKVVAKAKPTDGKKTRQASYYNMFIRDTMARLKTEGHKGNLMKLAVNEWNKQKGGATVKDSPIIIDNPEFEEDYE